MIFSDESQLQGDIAGVVSSVLGRGSPAQARNQPDNISLKISTHAAYLLAVHGSRGRQRFCVSVNLTLAEWLRIQQAAKQFAREILSRAEIVRRDTMQAGEEERLRD